MFSNDERFHPNMIWANKQMLYKKLIAMQQGVCKSWLLMRWPGGGVDQPSLFAFASTARSTSYTTAHRITVEQDNIPSVNERGKGAQATAHCLQGLLPGPLVSTNYTHWV